MYQLFRLPPTSPSRYRAGLQGRGGANNILWAGGLGFAWGCGGLSVSSSENRAAGARNGSVWVVAVLLAFIAGTLWARRQPAVLPHALAQSGPMAGARGVYAFTGQLDASHSGLFMLDIEQGTIWCYAIEPAGGTQKLRLIAARSWIYDRYLRDFNCAEPTYRMVQELVAKQRLAPADDRPDEGQPDQRP